MKITILADHIVGGGGAGVVAWNHARALFSQGHVVTVITTSEKKELEGLKDENGISVFTLYSKYPSRVRAYISLNNHNLVKRVDRILSSIQPDIVHAHNIHYHLSYASLKAAKKYAAAIFLTAHDSMSFHYSKLFPQTIDSFGCDIKSYKVSFLKQLCYFKLSYNPFRNVIIKKYLRIPTKIFAVSNALAQALSDNGIKNVEVLHNGIDVKEWEIGAPISRRDTRDYLFFGGRLSAVKGGMVLMEAMKQVLPVRSNTRLLVVGEDNDFSRKMEEEAKKIGIDDLILFTGSKSREEMKHMYPLSTLVVVPSLCFDWFPTIILEAMACKKAVIGTCFGGAKEMIEDGKTGYVINPQNVQELANAIIDLLNNPHKVDEMGAAGYERVKKEFSMEVHMQKLLAWYDKALQE